MTLKQLDILMGVLETHPKLEKDAEHRDLMQVLVSVNRGIKVCYDIADVAYDADHNRLYFIVK